MKIGILTFHSEMNYGCTLQAYAMQEVYKELGHDPVIIDRYITRDNQLLLGPLVRKGFTGLIKNCIFSFVGVGTYSMIRRARKTMAFHKKYMIKTQYSFYDWNDAPKQLGVEMISVGSDQIWNANLFSPIPYLLKDFKENIPAISYAASIGMSKFPTQYLEEYKAGFARFQAISIRERQGVQMVTDLGFNATQVVDPTLLVSSKVWEPFRCKKTYKKKRLLCYTLAENLLDILPTLERFAKRNECDVILFPDRYEKRYGSSLKGLYKNFSLKYRLMKSPVNIYISAAIEDFLREISAASWIVTNSYHAMMFSIIYRRNVRVVIPTDDIRKDMHARMKEFEGTVISGPLMQNSIEEAMTSFEKGERVFFNEESLKEKVESSRRWLQEQLEIIENINN